jgi:hypothetical protein
MLRVVWRCKVMEVRRGQSNENDHGSSDIAAVTNGPSSDLYHPSESQNIGLRNGHRSPSPHPVQTPFISLAFAFKKRTQFRHYRQGLNLSRILFRAGSSLRLNAGGRTRPPSSSPTISHRFPLATSCIFQTQPFFAQTYRHFKLHFLWTKTDLDETILMQ